MVHMSGILATTSSRDDLREIARLLIGIGGLQTHHHVDSHLSRCLDGSLEADFGE